MKFNSRRSVVHSTKGIIASTQPLATAAGLSILNAGGNSVDAAVAVAAAICVMEPASTGIGGDCFVLHYHDKKVYGLNGSGRAPKKLSVKYIRENTDITGARMPLDCIHTVTVPGAVAGWLDAVEKWGSGKVSLAQILQPAIDLAEQGHPVSEVSAQLTAGAYKKLVQMNPHKQSISGYLNKNGEPPNAGDLVKNPQFAEVLKLVVANGKAGFYEGAVAQGIVKEIQSRGGVMELGDLSSHESTVVDPIYIDFHGHRFWEIPPNGQGLVVLIALGLIRELEERGVVDFSKIKHNSWEHIHLMSETLKLGFYDSDEYVSDPLYQDVDPMRLLTSEYLKERSKLFSWDKTLDSNLSHGVPNVSNKSDTVYFSVADKDGNATSFINSVYTSFGSGIVPNEMGFALHNRGGNFNLTEGTKNCLAGGKRPYHTIIPSMITNSETNELEYSLANMGGFIQPQAQLTHFLNLTIFGLNPQQSLDSPRFCLMPHPDHEDRGVGSDGPVSTSVSILHMEDDYNEQIFEELRTKGHHVKVEPSCHGLFGRGQIIKNISQDGVLVYAAGSDKRGDGAAVPQI